MDSVRITNLRCFRETGNVPIRPLTLLVGENSTGKSTFLAALRAAWDLANGGGVDFNEEPFGLGSFDDLVHRARNQAHDEFLISSVDSLRLRDRASEDRPHSRRVVPILRSSTFRRDGALPVVARQLVEADEFRLTAEASRTGDLVFKALDSGTALQFNRKVRLGATATVADPALWLRHLLPDLPGHEDENSPRLPAATRRRLMDLIIALRRPPGSRPVAIAPVRTRPRRTYDQIGFTQLPEGAHIPLALARARAAGGEDWEHIKTLLARFGSNSGLFRSLSVRNLGRRVGNPFQIQVRIAGTAINLVDVGYGVSQALPILIDPLLATGTPTTFLLQQPEVHLHPKAQAEAGSFFAQQTEAPGIRGHRFIIETHSDYLVDRIRMEVRKEMLPPESVVILFFEREGTAVKIHAIDLDREGNLTNAPPSYREFFLAEQRELLGI